MIPRYFGHEAVALALLPRHATIPAWYEEIHDARWKPVPDLAAVFSGIAFYLFANYYEILAAHGVNLLSLLVLSYLFFGLVGVFSMRSLHRTFLVSDTITTPEGLMFGIVYATNMFGAGLEVILKNEMFANPITGLVIYPGLFLIASALFAWVWERNIRSTAISAILSVVLFAVIIALDYFHVPVTWMMLCLAVIEELFPVRPPILTTTASALDTPTKN